MADLMETLRLYCDDPMWAEHVEMPKKLLRHAVDRLDALEAENRDLREIVSKCCNALPNGAFCRPEASVDFMKSVPDEILSVTTKMVGEIATLSANLEQERHAGRRPFSDRLAQKVIDGQVKEIDRLSALVVDLRVKLGKVEAETRERLTKTPAIEEITPTPEEWERCETIGDTYDLMKRRITSALRNMEPRHD